MLHQFGDSVADDEIPVGNSQGQSHYTTSIQTANALREGPTAPHVGQHNDMTAYSLHTPWPSIFQCINPTDICLPLFTEQFSTGFGSSLHLDAAVSCLLPLQLDSLT